MIGVLVTFISGRMIYMSVPIQVMIFTQFTYGKYGKSDLNPDFGRLFSRTEIRTYRNTNIKKLLIRFCDTDKSRTDKVRRINNSHTWKRSLTVKRQFNDLIFGSSQTPYHEKAGVLIC